MFYSEGSESEGGRRGTPAGASRGGRKSRGPPSAPRQRRDFGPPPPIRIPPPDAFTSSRSFSQPSSRGLDSLASSSQDGIRIVASHSQSASDSIGHGSRSGSGHDSQGVSSSSDLYDSRVFPSNGQRPERIREESSDSFNGLPPQDERRLSAHAPLVHNNSRDRLDNYNPHRNSAIEDADESGGSRPRSAVYAPPDTLGSPTTSAVIFNEPRDDQLRQSGLHSPSTYSDYSGWGSPNAERIRLVGSVASSPYVANSPFVPYTPNSPVTTPAVSSASRQQSHKRTGSYIDPLRVTVHVNEPFRFTPRMSPAPFVAISGSPGRGGPPKATYHAYVDPLGDTTHARQPLPDWIHFDGASLEMFGLPRRQDAGVLPVLVLERKEMRTPGSPTRRARLQIAVGERDSFETDRTEDESEMIVARYEIEGESVGLRFR